MSVRTNCFAFALCIALASLGNADTLTFTTTAENTLYQTSGTANQLSNALGDIYAGRTNESSNSIRRGLIEFNARNQRSRSRTRSPSPSRAPPG